jgi:hypothetical protein
MGFIDEERESQRSQRGKDDKEKKMRVGNCHPEHTREGSGLGVMKPDMLL